MIWRTVCLVRYAHRLKICLGLCVMEHSLCLLILLILWICVILWVIFAVVFSTGSDLTSFQIYDDTPDWFLERVNKRLDKLLGHTNAALS